MAYLDREVELEQLGLLQSVESLETAGGSDSGASYRAVQTRTGKYGPKRVTEEGKKRIESRTGGKVTGERQK